MNAISRYFVTAKHWQLFLVLVGILAIGGLLAPSPGSSDLRSLGGGFWIPTIALYFVVSVYAILWIWSWGSFLSSVTPGAIRLKLRFFRVAAIVPFICPLLFNLVPSSSGLERLLLPFGLFALFCAFYIAYFISKSLVLAETGKPASLSDYVVPFLLLWFYFIGLWFIQPRINRLFLANRPGNAPVSR